MTKQSRSIVKTLVLTGLVLQPLVAGAQTSRPSTATTRQTTSPATPAPAPPPAPVGTAGTTAATTPAPAARAVAAVGRSDNDYRLGAGDKLRIEVYREPQLSQSLQVRPDGKITLPLVGDIAAAGRTSIELRDAVTTSLTDYVKNPVVTVIVQEAQSNQIYVIGEVANPGPQVLVGPLTALQALARAGGLKEFAKAGDIKVLRETPSGRQAYWFDYKGALKGKADPLVLLPGDTLVVP